MVNEVKSNRSFHSLLVGEVYSIARYFDIGPNLTIEDATRLFEHLVHPTGIDPPALLMLPTIRNVLETYCSIKKIKLSDLCLTLETFTVDGEFDCLSLRDSVEFEEICPVIITSETDLDGDLEYLEETDQDLSYMVIDKINVRRGVMEDYDEETYSCKSTLDQSNDGKVEIPCFPRQNNLTHKGTY